MTIPINPVLDLMLEREVDVSPEEIWHAWTTPEHLKQWFCPLPYKTVTCEIDLKPGGRFYTVMQSPEGLQFPNTGCYLEVIPNQKLSWTNALEPGFRPAKSPEQSPGHECAELLMTATITLQATANGTRYTASVLHPTAESKQRHEAMGFEQGWSMVLDQLVAAIKQAR
ncbi:MAG: SRPBCC family protein [Methylophilus sp.]|uniref:SRPBCC family protein n=1 Tax=Methylophilus sp. TaxID=29541 RepID=UPI003FA0A0F3